MSCLLITQLSVEGLRSLDHVELDLSARADVTRGQDHERTAATPTVLIVRTRCSQPQPGLARIALSLTHHVIALDRGKIVHRGDS